MQSKDLQLIENYKDRGMIKWQPFVALEHHQDLIKELEKEIENLKTIKLEKIEDIA